MVTSFSWGKQGELDYELKNPGKNCLAIGIQPHACEPLGSLIFDVISTIQQNTNRAILLIKNIEPCPKVHQYKQEYSLYDFLKQFCVFPISEQVEFNYGHNSRSKEIVELLQDNNVTDFVMLHNDPFNSSFYEYANSKNEQIFLILKKYSSKIPLPDYHFTRKIDDYTYSYFQKEKIEQIFCSRGNSAGIYLENKNIRTRTLEIPLFEWKNQKDIVLAQRLYSEILTENMNVAQRTLYLSENYIPEVQKTSNTYICHFLIEYFSAFIFPEIKSLRPT